MDYEQVFHSAVERIRGEGRYRVFCDLARQAGAFPRARRYANPDAEPHPVAVWCSNDYLGMGQHPVALDVLSIKELVRQRSAAQMNPTRVNSILYENEELLELGVADVDRIRIERVKL